MLIAEWISNLLTFYAGAGLLFGVAFVLFGVHHVDPQAKDTNLSFRLMILPGVAALWPLFARKWMGARSKT